MGCQCRRDSGLAFHCLCSLRPLGLTGLAKGYMNFPAGVDVFVFFLFVMPLVLTLHSWNLKKGQDPAQLYANIVSK